MKKIKIGICVDFMGSFAHTPEEERESIKERFSEYFLPTVPEFYELISVDEYHIKPGTDVILFDYGGMLPGNSLMEDNSRRLVQWAIDNPSSLAIVVSHFTWRTAIQYEMESMGVPELPNLFYPEICQDNPIPEWFLNKC